MSKLTIKNIIIEKSSKDIKTGINYEFSEGLNLICGNNEAGKSSLMNFIKQGFFREKGVDSGKIYFNILLDNNEIKNYRADIKDARLIEPRLKLFDENNNTLNYEFIEKNINQKYFEQGFHINLDDLMNIQNKDTSALVDIIKDPSGEKLTSLIECKKNEAKKILGENNRLTKETSLLRDKISVLDVKINELSNMEQRYNNTVNLIKSFSDDIEVLCEKEEYINIIIKLNELNILLDSKQEEYNKLKTNFNEKLFNNKETYLKIIQNAGKFEANLKVLEKNKNKSEIYTAEINAEIHRLQNEFALNIDENNINNCVLDFLKIKKIKELIHQKNILEKELISIIPAKENIEENLLKLKYELASLNLKIQQQGDILKLKDLYKTLNEQLKQYNFLLAKINDNEKSSKTGNININFPAVLIVLFVLALTASVLTFIKNIPIKISSVIISVISISGIISLIFVLLKNRKSSQKDNYETQKNKILNSIKEKLPEIYPEIENIQTIYIAVKAENIISELQNKIQNYDDINELIENNRQQTLFNEDKLNIQKEKVSAVEEKINSVKDELQSLINSSGVNIDISVYLDVINIIKTIKDTIAEKDFLLKETADLMIETENFRNSLNSFILNNQINIPLSENYEENISILKKYNDKNTEIKQQLDILNIEIQNLKTKQEKINSEKIKFTKISTEQFRLNPEFELEEIKKEKEEKIKQKNEAEYNKKDVEKFEGLNDLKTERNIILDSYRKKISELVTNKMIISLTETAKNNFNKICPDLKNAQKYLSILTSGKYSTINLDLAEIQNKDKTITKKWEELSRGTKEQLYLALRLGYAENYSKEKITLEPNGKADLPVIIDDAFVNFDPERTKNAIKCLLEMSKTNQILFFTCKKEIMQNYFKPLLNNEMLNIIEM